MFQCSNCGEVERGIFDGYSVGDRMLEGVRFWVWYDNGWYTEIHAGDKNYFEQFNEEFWLRQIREAMESGLEYITCPKCHEELEYAREETA